MASSIPRPPSYMDPLLCIFPFKELTISCSFFLIVNKPLGRNGAIHLNHNGNRKNDSTVIN